jgi:hypothetical protein
LFKQRFLSGLADGSVTVAYRNWRRPTVKMGGTLQTPAGQLGIDSVDVVELSSITAPEAARAGYKSKDELLAELSATRQPDRRLYRIAFHRIGPDPRRALRGRSRLTADEAADISKRLARLDRASTHGPWTTATLELIAERPTVRAADLAASVGREKLPFKADVRKLKALGLTESLDVGYRLSPRGRAWLARQSKTP